MPPDGFAVAMETGGGGLFHGREIASAARSRGLTRKPL